METWLIISLALSVAADQTFSKIGPVEFLLALSLICTGLLALPGMFKPRLPLRCLSGILFLASIAFSAVVGVAVGVPIPSVFRSAAPYLLLGLAFPYMVSGRVEVDRRFLLTAVASIATIHSLYLLGIYFVANDHFDVPFDILVNRITLIDNRAMNPVFLTGAAAGVAVYVLAENRSVRFLAGLAAIVSILAAVATVARTFAFAALLGPVSILALSAVIIWRSSARRAAMASVGILVVAALALAFVPAFSIMTKAMLLRHETQVAAAETTSAEVTVGGGRLTDEWPSAWKRYTEGTVAEKLLGIGAGNPFTLMDGTERTYVHNWPIYLLLYQGIFGVVAFTIFIATLGFTALRQWWVRNDVISLASLGILATMYSSAMFFANHKLLSFNLLLVMVYLMVMSYRGQACR